MIRRPPRSTLDRSSAASDVYKRQDGAYSVNREPVAGRSLESIALAMVDGAKAGKDTVCLLYTSPSPRDRTRSRMPSSA